jgi:hypothetical protein
VTKTQTPAEFDATELAVMTEVSVQERLLIPLNDTAHYLVGDLKAKSGFGARPYWQLTDGEAEMRLHAMAEGADEYDLRYRVHPSQLLVKIVEARNVITGLNAQIAELEEVYRTFGWTRWYPCLNSDGHIHSSSSGCPTLHRMGQETAMGWETRLSGQPVEVVIADLGPRLCSVCFPEAPAEHCRSLSDITRADREAARTAKNAERDAKLAVKNLAETFVTFDRDRVTTVAEAKRLVRKAAETAVELEWARGEDVRTRWNDDVRYANYIGNIAQRLEGERADAVKLSNILINREAAAPGTGWTWQEHDKAVAGATKRTRKAYFG